MTSSFENTAYYADINSLDHYEDVWIKKCHILLPGKMWKAGFMYNLFLKNIMQDITNSITIIHCILLVTKEIAYNTDESAAKNS